MAHKMCYCYNLNSILVFWYGFVLLFMLYLTLVVNLIKRTGAIFSSVVWHEKKSVHVKARLATHVLYLHIIIPYVSYTPLFATKYDAEENLLILVSFAKKKFGCFYYKSEICRYLPHRLYKAFRCSYYNTFYFTWFEMIKKTEQPNVNALTCYSPCE